MKKTFTGCLLFAGLTSYTFAQSSITLYGSIDGGVRYLTNAGSTAATAHSNTVSMTYTGLNFPNRFGFKGVEDLGAGFNAHFTLESGFNTGTGALDNSKNVLFNRQAFVGLGSSSLGSLDFGRQYSISNKTTSAYDTFGFRYLSIINVASATVGPIRLDNDIQYTNSYGPVTGRIEYSPGGQPGSFSDGSTTAMGLTFTGTTFGIGGAYTTQQAQVGSVNSTSFRQRSQFVVGSFYNFGNARITAGYLGDTTPITTGDTRTRTGWAGASYRFTPSFVVTGGYYQTNSYAPNGDGAKRTFIVDVNYFLSKTTLLYAEIDTAGYSGNYTGVYPSPAGQTRQNGISIGLNHLF
ncbi:porin [Paraburkholderia nemoris]|uniref:porin n=1 Tax=Paraburkholderia nemoris TaxID=2793076 RepID=UPI0038B841DA